MTTNIIPELNNWIDKILKESPIRRERHFDLPSKLGDYRDDTSILSNLFKYTTIENDISIFYENKTINNIDDNILKKRLQVRKDVNTYVCDTSNFTVPMKVNISENDNTGYDIISINIDSTSRNLNTIIGSDVLISNNDTNIFEITEEEMYFLYILNMIKRGKYIHLPNIQFSNLTSSLSKLIYIFIKAVQDNDYTYYNTTNLITDETDNCFIKVFEKWVSDQIYNIQKLTTSELINYNKTINSLTEKTGFYKLDSEQIENKYFSLDTTGVFSSDHISIYFNDQKQDYGTDYILQENNKIVWDGYNLQSKITIGSVLFIIYSE